MIPATTRCGWNARLPLSAIDCLSSRRERVARPRILFLEQQSSRAGAERVLEEVLCAIEGDFTPLVAFPEDGPFAADLRDRGIETVFFPLGRYRSGRKSAADMLAFPARSLYCARCLAQIIRRENVELVYINSPRCLVAGMLAARYTAVPSLFHLHMTMTRRSDLLVAGWAARRVTKIVACSKTAAWSLMSRYRDLRGSIQVIYNPARKPLSGRWLEGPAGALACALASHSAPVIGVVGRINRQKGHHVLLRAAAILARRGLNIHLVFVGAPNDRSTEDAVYRRSLESAARAWGLAERVFWAGHVEDPNVFYAVLDGLVIPSIVAEGMPMVALEALQWGVPVIGSRVGGIPEVVFDDVNGFLTPPENADALAGCLERLLRDSGLRTRLQAGARASVDVRFSLKSFQRDIRQAICGLTGLSSGVNEEDRETGGARGQLSLA